MPWMFMPFRRYADFGGRSRRTEFWLFFLFLTLVYVALFTLIYAVALSLIASGNFTGDIMAVMTSLGVFGIIILVFWLATLLPWLAVSARRLHDLNLSGWWLAIPYGVWLASNVLRFVGTANRDPALLAAAQLFALLWMAMAAGSIVVFCLPGTRGANRYGPDPMGPTDVADVFA